MRYEKKRIIEEREAENSIKFQPNYSEAYSNLGSLLSRQGKDQDAMGFFKKSIMNNSRYFGPRVGLCKILQKRGQYNEAVDVI